MPSVPLIEFTSLRCDKRLSSQAAAQVADQANALGVCSIVQHGLSPALMRSLVAMGRRAFARYIAAERGAQLLPGRHSWSARFRAVDLISHRSDQPGPHTFFRPPAPHFSMLERHRLSATAWQAVRAVAALGHGILSGFGEALDDDNLATRFVVDFIHRQHVLNDSKRQLLHETTDSGLDAPNSEGLFSLVGRSPRDSLQVICGGRSFPVPYVPGSLLVHVSNQLSAISGGRYPSPRCYEANHLVTSRTFASLSVDSDRDELSNLDRAPGGFRYAAPLEEAKPLV
jgi:isopenicillin N synthase-like dioxygenase